GDGGTGPDAEACSNEGVATCDGDLLSRCTGGQLITEDCGAQLADCVDGAGGAACVDQCVEAGVTADGSCVTGGIERCVEQGGHHRVVTEACGVGSVCSEPTDGPAECVGDPCADVGPQGRCDGDVLTRCDAGGSTETDCGASGQVCAYAGDATGYACVAPAGAFRVSGTIRYEDRPPQTNGSLGAIVQAPVRGAVVSVIADQGNAVLATGVVADDGTYTLHYDTTAGAMVHVMVSAQSTLAIRPVRVLRTNTAVHGFGGASFAAAASVTQDVLVTDASGTSEAFNILDQMIMGMDAIRNTLGDATPTALSARWTRGSNNGTYYSNNSLYLLGASSDDDGYDDTVILHEFGHFVEDSEGRSDNPGGSHNGSADDPNLAWSEGFSTYWAMVTRGAPWYMDSNSGGGWGYNADTDVTQTPQPNGPMNQDVSEDMITEDLWDIGDAPSGDDDPMTTGNHGDVLRIEPLYLRTATLRNVGEAGVDLVDFLDGWFLLHGLTSCDGVRSVVTGTRSFPYDYAGPGGSCP
ncbi:MAG: hypothetical protein KC464_04785, partial [Myxococcales bacterium]|nr:hypothetical protein [Myxococcales bacterium]